SKAFSIAAAAPVLSRVHTLMVTNVPMASPARCTKSGGGRSATAIARSGAAVAVSGGEAGGGELQDLHPPPHATTASIGTRPLRKRMAAGYAPFTPRRAVF